MKIIYWILIIVGFIILPSNICYSQKVYQEFDVWDHVVNNNTKLSLKAYITVDSLNTKNTDVLYVYSFNIISSSTISNQPTTTWLYGTRVYVDDVEVSKDTYPNGFMIGVNTIPTSVYKYTTENNKVKFGIDWIEAVADPRIRN